MKQFDKLLLLTGLGLLSGQAAQAQTGIGTGATAPRTMLDVNGAVAVTETTAAVSGNAATVPTGFSLVRLTGTATTTITLTGASSPAAVAGQLVTVYNATASDATFNGQAVPAGQAVAFVYSNSGWRAVGDGGAALTANNGLTKTGSNVQLGGNLVQATVISNVTSANTLNISSPIAADAALTVGSTSGTAGRLQLGNSNHGILRDLSGSKSLLDNTTAGNLNDVAVYTSNSGGGSLHLVANPSATGSTSLPLGQFTLLSNNYVGIGTPSPTSRLQVVDNGTGGTNDDVVVLSYGATGTPGLGLQRARGTAAAPANLQAGDLLGTLGLSGRYNGSISNFGLSGMTGYYQGDGITALSDLRLLSSGVERMRLDPTGKVGIGSTSPTQTLTVNGGVQVSNYSAANDAVSAQGAHLQWNRSGGEGETWLLNQRGTSTIASAGIRFGDVTTGNVVTEYGRFFYNGAFRLSAYGSNAATSLITTAPIGYLAVGADGTIMQTANGNSPNIYTVDGTIINDRTVTLGGHTINFKGSDGNFQFNATGNTFSTSANSLLITQTGDQYKSSSISLRNRTGQNGLNVSTANDATGQVQVGVTDLTMQTQGSGANTSNFRVKQSNVRLESRINGKSGAGFTYILGPYSATTDSTEVQIFTNPSVNGTSTNGYNNGLLVGNNYAVVSTRLGVGSGSNVIGSRLSLSPAMAEAKITLFDGGVNGQITGTAATTHYGFGVSTSQLNYDVMSGASHVFYVSSKNGSGTEVLRANATGVTVASLAGTGSRPVAADANGLLSAVVPNATTAATTPNIYSTDGTLASIRTVTQGSNMLIFSGAATLSKLSGATGANTGIVLGRTAEEGTFGIAANTNQYFGGAVAGDVTLRASGPANNLFVGTTGTGASIFGTSNAERMRITSGGLVGIGLTNPTQALTVSGGITASGSGAVSTQGVHLQWNRSAGNGETWLLNQRGTNTLATSTNLSGIRFGDVTTADAVTEWARFDGSGNFGIGVTPPAGGLLLYKLDVNGNIHASGTVTATSVVQTSDARLKRNVTPLAGALATVQQLRPVQYDKKATIESTDYSRHELGFIAQELRQVLPSLVSEGKDANKTLAVSYIELIPVLTKAMQEQQVEIEALEATNSKLASENRGLKASLDGKASASTLDELQVALKSLRAEVQALKAAGTTDGTTASAK